MLLVATAGCGKKGPPLAPFVRVPALVTAVTPQRVGDDVYLSFAVPTTNVDGQKPADIAAVEVYAVTADRPPADREAARGGDAGRDAAGAADPAGVAGADERIARRRRSRCRPASIAAPRSPSSEALTRRDRASPVELPVEKPVDDDRCAA